MTNERDKWRTEMKAHLTEKANKAKAVRSAQEMVDELSDEARSQISDGYHTFGQLYEHRDALFIALANSYFDAAGWKSRHHADGTMFPGFFIAGINLRKFGEVLPITYHLEDKYWDMLHVDALVHAPEWDGHTSADVVNRLILWATGA